MYRGGGGGAQTPLYRKKAMKQDKNRIYKKERNIRLNWFDIYV